LQRKRLFPGSSPAEEKCFRLWKQTPSIEAAKYKAIVQLLIFFAKQLSALSNQLLIEQKCREPEVVMRARRLITENKRDRLSLSLRRRPSAPVCFISCSAKRPAKFSDYVARSRIKMRARLCDPRRRMCEWHLKPGSNR
jgi:hypothetical protein